MSDRGLMTAAGFLAFLCVAIAVSIGAFVAIRLGH